MTTGQHPPSAAPRVIGRHALDLWEPRHCPRCGCETRFLGFRDELADGSEPPATTYLCEACNYPEDPVDGEHPDLEGMLPAAASVVGFPLAVVGFVALAWFGC